MNFAGLVARRIWAGMLWLMRRRGIRRFQRRMISAVPAPARPRFHEMFLAQERFARRHGLRMLTLVVGLFFVSLAFTMVYSGMTEIFNRGWLKLPEAQELPGNYARPAKPLDTTPVVDDGEPRPSRPTNIVPTAQ
jgi:hypothetical protein